MIRPEQQQQNDSRNNQSAPRKKPAISEKDLQGFKCFQMISELLEPLKDCAAHPNRKLTFDEYTALVLFYFFNPIITSLRGLQQVSELEKVQKVLGIRRMSLGSMSESVRAFDPELLGEIFGQLHQQVKSLPMDKRIEALTRELTAVDGTLLPALPRMAWALWQDPMRRAAKAHVHFEVLKGMPVSLQVTDANSSEIEQLRARLEAGRFYIMDRGYRDYRLFQEIIDVGSSFVGRVQSNTVYETIETRPLSLEAIEAGVVSDQVVRLGGKGASGNLRKQVRLVEIYVPESSDRDFGAKRSGGHTLLLVTDQMDLDADLIGLIYQHRWHVELFFRWMKDVLGCRHLLSDSKEGVTIQVYCALIATVLIALWTGRKPTKRTYELVGLYMQGWATREEVMRHIERLKQADVKKS